MRFLPHMAPDAMVVFHDLVSPHVTAGLKVMKDAGWNIELFNTVQILGIAWRGNVSPRSMCVIPTHHNFLTTRRNTSCNFPAFHDSFHRGFSANFSWVA